MRPRISLALLGLVVTMLPIQGAQAATHRIEYLPPPDMGYHLCDKETLPGTDVSTGLNLGAVCVAVTGNKEVRIDGVEDDLGTDVDLSWYWLDETFTEVDNAHLEDDPAGWVLGEGPSHHGTACSDTNGAFLPAPNGAKYFYVFIHGPGETALFASCDIGTTGSHGFLTLTVRNK